MNAIAPVWDGNETCPVLDGGGLFAVFPPACAIVMPELCAPIVAMLLGLIFRGVAFEFIHRARRTRVLWERGFALGSLVATFSQAIAPGALVQGHRGQGAGLCQRLEGLVDALRGPERDCARCRIRAAWRDMAGDEGLRAHSARRASARPVGGDGDRGFDRAREPRHSFHRAAYATRWFAWPTAIFSVVVPALVPGCAWLLCAGLLCAGLVGRVERQPFFASPGLFVLSFAGLGISFHPDMVPPGLTIREAAAPDASLSFLLVGALVLIPMIPAYTAHACWVFRGKVHPGEGYHRFARSRRGWAGFACTGRCVLRPSRGWGWWSGSC